MRCHFDSHRLFLMAVFICFVSIQPWSVLIAEDQLTQPTVEEVKQAEPAAEIGVPLIVPSTEDGTIESRGGLPRLQLLGQDVSADLSVTQVLGQLEYSRPLFAPSNLIGTIYTVSVKNLGKDPAHGVRISFTAFGEKMALSVVHKGIDSNEPGVYLRVNGVADDTKCTILGLLEKLYASATCMLETLNAGQSVDMLVRLTSIPYQGRYPSLFGQVMSATPDPNLDNNGVLAFGADRSVPAETADLTVTQSGIADLGNQTQTYQISVRNQGNTLANYVTFTQTFSQALTGASIARLDSNGPSTTCSSREVRAGLSIVSCTVQQLEVGATAGATIVYRNPGNVVRTSTVQAMSALPDLKRVDNTMTTTVPARPSGGLSIPQYSKVQPPITQQQPTAPPAATLPPSVMATPLPPSSVIGIIQPMPLQRQPQAATPAQQQPPPVVAQQPTLQAPVRPSTMVPVQPKQSSSGMTKDLPVGPPVITGSSCSRCAMGSRVTIFGQHLGGAAASLNYGFPLSYTSGVHVLESSPAQLTFQLPILTEAREAFRVTLTNVAGSSQAYLLVIDRIPRLTEVNPLAGISSNWIVLKGVNLHTTKSVTARTNTDDVRISSATTYSDRIEMFVGPCTGKARIYVGTQYWESNPQDLRFQQLESPELSCQ